MSLYAILTLFYFCKAFRALKRAPYHLFRVGEPLYMSRYTYSQLVAVLNVLSMPWGCTLRRCCLLVVQAT